MKVFSRVILILLSGSLLLTAGCNTSRKVNKQIIDNTRTADHLKHQVKQQVKPYRAISRRDGFWVSAQELEIRESEPTWLEDHVVMRIAAPMSPSDAIAAVSEIISTPISIKPNAMALLKTSGSSGDSAEAGTDSNKSSGSSGGEASSDQKIYIDYNGTKRGLLDQLAGQLGIYWKMVRGQVEFFLFETRLFQISTLGGSMESSASVGSGGSGGSSGGGSGSSGSSGGSSGGASAINAGRQQMSVEMNSEIWTDLVKIVESLGSPGGKVEASESLGLITVTDVPPVLDSIALVIEKMNASMNTQILVDVRVYSLEFKDKDDYQIDWNAIFTTAAGGATAILTSAPPAATGLSALTATAIAPSPRWRRWKDTNAAIKALSKIGKVAMLTSGTMITMNNQPVPINLQRSVTYLASAQSGAISTGVATGPTLTPGTVNTGFQMSIMPRVLDAKRVMLQCTMNISSLQSLGTISSGTGANALTIQTPEVISRSLLQRAMLQSGETLILTGFEQTELTSNRQGIGHPDNIITGGERLAEEKKSTLIVMITPYIVESKK